MFKTLYVARRVQATKISVVVNQFASGFEEKLNKSGEDRKEKKKKIRHVATIITSSDKGADEIRRGC